MFGKQILQPRLTALYGDPKVRYGYSGIAMEALPFTEVLEKIKVRLQEFTNQEFTHVLCNFYRDGQDSMGWHRDNEPELGPEPLIASVSLGAVRRFVLRNREHPERKHVLELPHGSLLVMGGATQRDWEHSLPKSARVQGARINLTFRRL